MTAGAGRRGDEGAFPWPEVGAVAALALAARLAAWALIGNAPTPSNADEIGYVRDGLLRLEGREVGPFWPPLTGWLVTAVAWTSGRTDLEAIRLAFGLLDAANAVLVFAVARAALPSPDGRTARSAPLLAGLAYALYVNALGFGGFVSSETPAAFLLLLGGLVLLRRPTAPGGAAAGLAFGLAALARASLLAVGPFAALALLAFPRLGPSRVLVAGLLGASSLVPPLLTAAVNEARHGVFTPASNAAFNLYIGNRAEYLMDLNPFDPRPTEAQRRARGGEGPSADDVILRRADPAWLRAEARDAAAERPLLFARRALGRVFRVVAPKTDAVWLLGGGRRAGLTEPRTLGLLGLANLQYALLTALGFAGLLLLARGEPGERGGAYPALAAAAVLAVLASAAAAIAKPRFSFGYEPLLFPAAAYAATHLRAAAAEVRRRWAVSAAALVVFAWASLAYAVFLAATYL